LRQPGRWSGRRFRGRRAQDRSAPQVSSNNWPAAGSPEPVVEELQGCRPVFRIANNDGGNRAFFDGGQVRKRPIDPRRNGRQHTWGARKEKFDRAALDLCATESASSGALGAGQIAGSRRRTDGNVFFSPFSWGGPSIRLAASGAFGRSGRARSGPVVDFIIREKKPRGTGSQRHRSVRKKNTGKKKKKKTKKKKAAVHDRSFNQREGSTAVKCQRGRPHGHGLPPVPRPARLRPAQTAKYWPSAEGVWKRQFGEDGARTIVGNRASGRADPQSSEWGQTILPCARAGRKRPVRSIRGGFAEDAGEQAPSRKRDENLKVGGGMVVFIFCVASAPRRDEARRGR